MIVIKVKPVKGKEKRAIGNDNVSKVIKTESEVYTSPVSELVKQLKKDALSGDIFPDVTARIEMAVRFLMEYESYTDKLAASNEHISAELAKHKEWRNKAMLVISLLNQENEELRVRVDELENRLSEIHSYFG